MIVRLRTFSLLLAASALVIAYGIGELWVWAILIAGLGILGGFGPRSLRTRFGNVWLLIFLIAAANGMMLRLPSALLVIAVVASLAYWDLDGFNQRLSSVEPSDMTRSLEKSHLRRLAFALSLGLAVSLVTLPIQIELGMVWAILLGLVIVISLRLGISALQRPKKPSV